MKNEAIGKKGPGDKVMAKEKCDRVFSWLIFLCFISSFFIFQGCATVSALDRGCLEDKDMELSASMSDAYGDNVMLYREGASGGNAGKTGGGCGCN